MRTTLFLFFVIGVSAVVTETQPKKCYNEQYSSVVKKFQEYVKIDTSKEKNIEKAVEFWRRQAAELGLPFTVYRPAGKPICVITWQGTDPSLPSIMLNSHMDVVPVEEGDWTYPPFSAKIDENCNIFGRGTQDTKDVSIQYIEAVGRLIKSNVTLKRTLHITLMPDEEKGGEQGMLTFIDTEDFKAMNVGFVLDEGLTSANETLYATYQDKRPWQMKFTVHGTDGHGFIAIVDTAMEKLRRLINIISKHREEQTNLKNSRSATDFGAYDTVNINIIRGGLITNSVPGTMSIVVDLRLATAANVTEKQEMVNSWIREAGNRTEVEYIRQINSTAPIPADSSNIYWVAMQDAAKDLGIEIKPIVGPASSDIMYLRDRGVPAFGFTTKSNTIIRLHSTNEYLNINTLLKGIDIYVALLKKLGNV